MYYSEFLDFKFDVDKCRFLYALSGVESSFGQVNQPRYEPAYGPTGMYFIKSQNLREQFSLHGKAAASSWGPWQILYIVAQEYGFKGLPVDLSSPAISAPYVVHHLNSFVKRGADTLVKVLDCYNTGNSRDKNVPHKYIEKFWKAYNETEKFIEQLRRGNHV